MKQYEVKVFTIEDGYEFERTSFWVVAKDLDNLSKQVLHLTSILDLDKNKVKLKITDFELVEAGELDFKTH